MARAIILVLDSVGIGGAPDAAAFGDAGADTIGHIAEACTRGGADSARRAGPLRLPHLVQLGLGEACRSATGRVPPGLERDRMSCTGRHGSAIESSTGKDTPSGHWELAGAPVAFDWGYFPQTAPCFPDDLVAALCGEADLPGILGNRHASGTEILAELGEEHVRTGRPICYTSADSVFQIAAHETEFGLERLYHICTVARRLLDSLRIGRVIARPFLDDPTGGYVRTANRRDYAVPPDRPTLLDVARAQGRDVISVGKIADIFAHSGTGREIKADGNDQLFDRTLDVLSELGAGGLLCTNFVDFDTLYGHRRDVAGYAEALERFDAQLPRLHAALMPDDLVVLTADHGCDPTWKGTDHTREQVPVLAFGPNVTPAAVGRRAFSDVAATAAAHLGLAWRGAGHPF